MRNSPAKPSPGHSSGKIPPMNSFKVLQKDGKARVGKLITSHGVIDTPNFIPVGTQATVKSLTTKDLSEIGHQIILANTYHLMLRPGEKLIKKLGGLHGFMSWDKPIMTDSGGFQVFSLGVALEHGNSKVLKEGGTEEGNGKTRPRLNRITEEGVTFQSHLDGSKHFLGPENSIKIQQDLGADLIVAFDDHESAKQTYVQVKESLELTKHWGLRSLKVFKNHGKQLMYGVIHGSTYEDLRINSAKFTDANFEAVSIGGIYGSREQLKNILGWCLPHTAQDKPRHLLGIGEVVNLFDGIGAGMDLFDCVAPTRRARNGSLYVSPKSKVYPNIKDYQKRSYCLNIRMAKYKKDPKPIDPTCACYTCLNFSRAYLHHLYSSRELTYHTLATYHNLYFINNLVKQIREAVGNKQFEKFKKAWI